MRARPDRYISALCLHRPGPRHSAAIRDARSENLAKYDQFLCGAAGFSIAPVAGGEEGGGDVEGWMGRAATIGRQSWLKPSLTEARFQPHHPPAGAQSYHNQAVCSSIVCQAGELQVWDRILLLTALKLSVTTSPPRPGKDRRIG